MKANQNFRTEEEAVSPVIGVILMVAITVVLAAVVFVLVSDLGGSNAKTQPAISWDIKESEDYAAVTSADPDADWSEFEIKMDVAGYYDLNLAVAIATGNNLVAGTFETVEAGAIGGGDKLYFCATTAGPATVTLRHIDSNAISKEITFNSLAACA